MPIAMNLRSTVRRVMTVAVAATIMLAACGDDSSSRSAAGASATGPLAAKATSVGAVDGTNALIAVQEQSDGSLLVYVCDGATVWDYLLGPVSGSSATATDALAAPRFTATRDGSGWKGTVRLPDGEHPFTTVAATGTAGLFSKATQPVKDLIKVGGWIRLADGRVQGKEVVVTASGTGGDTSAGGPGVGGATAVPPDAQPTSFGGLLKCGIAGARVKIAQNRVDRDPSAANTAALVKAKEEAHAACATSLFN